MDASEFAAKFQTPLSPEYLNFLRIHNGLNWNGLFIYGTESNSAFDVNGLVYENEGLRIDDDRFNNIIVFADDDMSYYVYQISSKEYQVLDKIPLDIMNKFSGFDDLLSEAFQSRLG